MAVNCTPHEVAPAAAGHSSTSSRWPPNEVAQDRDPAVKPGTSAGGGVVRQREEMLLAVSVRLPTAGQPGLAARE